jgi:hypothetical protein
MATLGLALGVANFLLTLFLIRRIRLMSVSAEQAQANLDALTAVVNQALPLAIQTMNDLHAAWLAAMAGKPTGLDPAKVQADIDAITLAVQNLSTATSNDQLPASDPTPPAA